jgi:hypothetical protein
MFIRFVRRFHYHENFCKLTVFFPIIKVFEWKLWQNASIIKKKGRKRDMMIGVQPLKKQQLSHQCPLTGQRWLNMTYPAWT